MGKYVTRALDREISKMKAKVARETGINITSAEAQRIIAGLMNNRTILIRKKRNGAKVA